LGGMHFEKTIAAWQQAAADLDIKIQSPFCLMDGAKKLYFEILVENFGGPNGTIVFSVDDMSEIKTAENYGFYYSALNLTSYEIYDRQKFIDTLNDWGYFGDPSQKPGWYTGKADI
jgi:hypothetical protein